jgi:hypothetical protein
VSNRPATELDTAATPLEGPDRRPVGPDTLTTRPAVRTLTEPECAELVALATVGRVGFVTPQGLQIIPLNVRSTGASLRLDTTPHSSLSQLAEMGRDVTLEVDAYDADTGHGWSVLMQGRLDKLDHQGALRPGDPRTQALGFTPRSYSGRVVQHEPPEIHSEQPGDERSTPDEQEKLS